MKPNFHISILITIAFMLVCGASTARAQGNSATLTGTVTDQSGAVIPHATILITDEASGVKRATASDERGVFSLVGIPVGTYDVAISAPGFNTLARKGIAVHINDQIELKEISLAVAAQNATVTVTAEGSELTPTTTGEVSYTITDTQLHDMDIEGRSAIELLGLIPGAGNTGNFNGTYNSASAGFTQNASAFTVNGNRFDQVSIVSDGASVTDLNTAAAVAVTPNVDMIAELKVQSAAYSAAEPNGPVVVSSETKSGGRELHGLAEITARDHVLNASDWQEKANGLPAPQTSLFYPALQVGGPFKTPRSNAQPKLFYFAATEISQQHVDLIPRSSVVPTAAMRTGDFSDSAYLTALSGPQNNWLNWMVGSNPCNTIWTVCGNGAKGWGQINSSVIDPGGKILLNALPLPNVDPSTHGGFNLISDYVVSEPRNQETLKLDYAATENTHASIRYNHENESVPSPYGPWNQWNQTPYPGAQTLKNASNSVNATLTNVLSPSLTNEASLVYTRIGYGFTMSNSSAVSRTGLNYPYGNLFQTNSKFLPNVSFEKNVGDLYLAGGEVPGFTSAQNMYTFSEGLTKLKGVHLIRFGVFWQMGRFNNLTGGDDNGSIDTENYSSYTGNDWADLLLGYTSNYSQSSANFEAAMENNRFDFYGEDAWKVKKRLTINYGLRVDHIGWWYDRGGRIAIFNPAAYNPSSTYTAYSGLQTHATTPSVPRSGWKPLGFEWAPAAGFAYDISGDGRTIIRGGFGTNYYVDPAINAFTATEAPPLFKAVSLWASSSPGYTLSGLSQLNYSTTLPSVWGTANPTDHRAPVTYSWNLAVSHLFWGANKIEANYVGNSSHNLLGWGITNAVPQGSETGPWYGTYYDQLYRPYTNYGDIAVTRHNLNSNYNAWQFTVTRQKGWLNYWGSYTFGKTLAYNAEDAFNMKRWYGPAPFDRTQILSFSYYLSLPSVSKNHLGNHKLGNAALDGWHVSGIFQAMSGGPIGNNFGSEYSVNQNTIGIWGPGNYNSFATGTPDEVAVPKLTCDPRKGLSRDQYFNPKCFAGPTLLSNGVYRLPYIHGPAYINDSTGLYKSFNLADKRTLEFRGEAFNLFNHPWNWFKAYDPNMYMGFDSSGNMTSTNPAGTIDNKIGHREFSLMARFNF
jgi:hypothetical protein